MALDLTAIDLDHVKIDDLFYEIDDAPDERLRSLSCALLAEIAQHFAREEALMLSAGFPGAHCHKEEHVRILVALEQGVADDATLRAFLTEDALSIMHDHLNTLDFLTAAFIRGEFAAYAERDEVLAEVP